MRLWHGREEWARSNFWQILRIRVEVNILKILIYLLKRAIRISLIQGIWMVEPWSSLVEGIRTTVSAQSSNVYGMLPHMCCIIDYHLGRYEPPSPSTKKVICSAILSFLQNKTKNSGAISDYIPTEGLPKFQTNFQLECLTDSDASLINLNHIVPLEACSSCIPKPLWQ